MNVYKLINDKLYFLVVDHKNAYSQLQKNPNCELGSFKGTGDWLRISGKAIFEKDDSKIPASLLDTNEELREIYKKNGYKATAFHLEGNVELKNLGTSVENFKI